MLDVVPDVLERLQPLPIHRHPQVRQALLNLGEVHGVRADGHEDDVPIQVLGELVLSVEQHLVRPRWGQNSELLLQEEENARVKIPER